MDRGPFEWNIDRLDQSSTDAIRNGLNELLLSGSLRVVDTEDVLLLRGRLVDLLHHASQVFDVDSRHEVLAFADNGQLLRVLLPRPLEVVVEDGLSKTVKDTS